jgi:DNA-binding winged helix-turn-helix (wHTH) protein/pimeloyl-ACP methyl ester carboxylesterase
MVYAFGDFTVDTRRYEVRRAGEPLHLEPQVYAVLCYLLENRDRLVRKEEILDEVWGHRFVTPATLNSRVRALRQALGDDGRAQRVVETIRGRGFRFVAEVATTADPSPSPTAAGEPPPGVTNASAVSASPATNGSAAERVEQKIRFCRAHDGVRIAYATSGRGPPLVKTANWLTHLEYDWVSPVWRHWLTELSRDHTLIRYDERGSGLSDWQVEDLSFDAWVRDLEAVVDELGLERFPLLGISQGCAVAVAYAARHPERVSRLLLYGGYSLGQLERGGTDAEREMNEMVVRVLPLGWGRDNPAFRQFFAALFLPEGTPEQIRWFTDLQRATTSPENAIRLRLTSAHIDVSELAARVRAPTLVLHATGDAAVPFEQGRLLAALIPGARFAALDGNNHIILETEPAWRRFLDETRSFLAAESNGSKSLLGSDRLQRHRQQQQ